MMKSSGFLSVGLLFLAGCSSFGPDPVACSDKITAPIEGARVSLRTIEDTSQQVEVRLNGVSGLCYNNENSVDMDISIGLKASRITDAPSEPLIFEVPVLTAILDSNDSVIETRTSSYQMAFMANKTVFYPVGEMAVTLPSDGRVVLSLASDLVQP